MQVLKPLAVLTLAIFAAPVLVQQTLRTGAMILQILPAEHGLGAAKMKKSDLYIRRIPFSCCRKISAAFGVIYDVRGSPNAADSQRDAARCQTPTLPSRPQNGVLNAVKIGGQNRVIWQPRPGRR